MKDHACLIAGPLNLDLIADNADTLGGSGFYAAAAAAPFAVSQLWSRAGGLSNQIKGVIAARHIDDSGVDYEGTTNRWSAANGFSKAGDVLKFTPASASDLTCALAIDLASKDMERAFEALDQLGDQVGRTLIVAPRLAHCEADPELLQRCCERAGVLILNLTAALKLCSTQNPITAARKLQEMGAKTVILPAGVLGGLAVYQQNLDLGLVPSRNQRNDRNQRGLRRSPRRLHRRSEGLA